MPVLGKRRTFSSPAAYAPAGGGSSEVLPSDLANLIAWFKADTGVTNTGNGTAATAWADQSGLGNHIGTGGSDPTYFSAGFNSLPSVTFTAASGNKLQSGGDFPMGSSNVISVFIVCQMLTGTSNFGRAVSYNKGPVGAGNDFDNAGSAALILRNGTTNAISAYANSAQHSSAAVSLATNYRLGVIFNGTNISLYVNGVQTGTPSAYTQNFVDSGVLAIGKDFNGTGAWDGPIAEVVIALSDISSDVAGLDEYFVNKWNL